MIAHARRTSIQVSMTALAVGTLVASAATAEPSVQIANAMQRPAPVLLAPPMLVSRPAGRAIPELQSPNPRLLIPEESPGRARALAASAAIEKPGAKITPVTGVWVEGPGFEVTYGGNFDGCAKRCLGNKSCLMIEYFRPEKKCNLYNTIRPRKVGGSSIVGIRG